MPHFSSRMGKPIHERSGRELIVEFVIAPIVIGAIMLIMVGWLTYQHHAEFNRGDWLGVAWALIVAPLLMIGLPATAWREWERRKQFKK